MNNATYSRKTESCLRLQNYMEMSFPSGSLFFVLHRHVDKDHPRMIGVNSPMQWRPHPYCRLPPLLDQPLIWGRSYQSLSAISKKR